MRLFLCTCIVMAILYRAQGSVLVSITSEEEQTAITQLISLQNEDFWLGYSDEVRINIKCCKSGI